jgi:hypothetical protein
MDFWRQLGILNPMEHLQFPITVIGCGGIGSPTILALSKMGCPDITVYDYDHVEPHNLPNQLHMLAHVGKTKVEGVAEIVRAFTGTLLDVKKEVVSRNHNFGGVVISGVDSMASREEIWHAIKFNEAVKLYIDARMGAEVFRIFTLQPSRVPSIVRVDGDVRTQMFGDETIEFYEASLISDVEALELPCTQRSIIYNVFVIAGLISNQVKKFAKGEPLDKQIIFDLVSMTLITQ